MSKARRKRAYRQRRAGRREQRMIREVTDRLTDEGGNWPDLDGANRGGLRVVEVINKRMSTAMATLGKRVSEQIFGGPSLLAKLRPRGAKPLPGGTVIDSSLSWDSAQYATYDPLTSGSVEPKISSKEIDHDEDEGNGNEEIKQEG